MDDIDIPADRVPEGLKACEQILKRAKEVKKLEPVVAYWCCFYAAQKALKVKSRTKEDTALLMSLLDALEQMKAILADNDAVHNEAAGAAYVQNFALKVFMSADNDDRKGITGKATIRKFVASGQFIEVLTCFENGMTEEKLSYARWKANDGAKALREGRTPVSGPPVPEAELSLPSLPSASPSSLPPSLPQQSSSHSSPALAADARPSPRPSPLGGSGKANLPNIDTSLSLPKAASSSSTNSNSNSTGNAEEAEVDALISGRTDDSGRTPQRTASTASGAWSTVATPGLADDEAEERRFPAMPTPGAAGTASTAKDGASPAVVTPKLPTINVNSDPAATPKSPGGGEKKNVRFMGPDGAPLSPAHTVFSVDSYDAPAAPPPTLFSVDGDVTPVGGARAAGAGAGPGDVSAPSTAKPNSTSHTTSAAATPTPADASGDPGRNARPRGNSDATNTPAPDVPTHANSSTGTTSARTAGLGLHGTNAEPPRTAPPAQSAQPSAPPTSNSSSRNAVPPPSAPPLHTVTSRASAPPTPAAGASAHTATGAAPPKPSRKTVEQCQKHARWAVSALEFDDPETARAELRKALALLG